MSKIKKRTISIIKQLIALFIFILIPIVLFILITSYSPAIFGIRTFNVLTGSMEPTIHIGSLVFSKPEKNYFPGDIISFKRNNIIITHRILEIKNGQFITKGDANHIRDPQLVSKYNIIGKIDVILPGFGKFISFIRTLPGFIIFVAIPIIIFIGLEIKTIKREWENEIEKKLLAKTNADG
jgi:signal peptidase I